MKTRAEVEELKRQWRADPCWDLPTCDGFAEHRRELEDFVAYCKRVWAYERKLAVRTKAAELDCSTQLAAYVIRLEGRLEKLEGGRP